MRSSLFDMVCIELLGCVPATYICFLRAFMPASSMLSGGLPAVCIIRALVPAMLEGWIKWMRVWMDG